LTSKNSSCRPLDLVVVLQLDAALEAGRDFAHVVLQAPHRLDFAGVDHHVVAQQAETRAAAHHAGRDHRAGHRADLGGHEHGAISAVPMTSSFCSGASMPVIAAFTSSTAS